MKDEKDFKPELIEEEKFLTNSELSTMNNAFKDLKLLELEEKMHKKDVLIVKLKKELLQHQSKLLDNEIHKLENKAKEKNDSQKKLKAENRDFSKSIAKKYELDEKWGFNPETGQII